MFKFAVDCYDALGVPKADIDKAVFFEAPEDTVRPVPVGDVSVMALIVNADPNAQLTTYTCEIGASKGAKPSKTAKGVEITPIDDEYAREQFFVTVE